MQIVSHRGLWATDAEKNSMMAFHAAWKLGFGIETDIRDLSGGLVISHDPPQGKSLKVQDFFEAYKQSGKGTALALNVKSDGLQLLLLEALRKFEVDNYFVFDMSVPDMLSYAAHNMRYFTRQSEYELDPCCYEAADGVWIDAFQQDWRSVDFIASHLEAGKKVCLVSSELHHRPYHEFWKRLKSAAFESVNSVLLCTDHPSEAKDYFYGED